MRLIDYFWLSYFQHMHFYIHRTIISFGQTVQISFPGLHSGFWAWSDLHRKQRIRWKRPFSSSLLEEVEQGSKLSMIPNLRVHGGLGAREQIGENQEVCARDTIPVVTLYFHYMELPRNGVFPSHAIIPFWCWNPEFLGTTISKKKHYLNGPQKDVGFQCQDLLIRNLPFLSLFNHMIFKQVIGYLMRYWYQCIRIKLTAPIIWLMSRHVQIKPQVIRSCSCCLGTGGQVLHPSSKNRSYSCSVSQQFAWWVHK